MKTNPFPREASFELEISEAPAMLDAMALARVATCNKALQVLFSDGVVGACMTHCREASERANLMEATLSGVTVQRDTARLHCLEVSQELRATTRVLVAQGRHVRELEQALADCQRELAEAKRARR